MKISEQEDEVNTLQSEYYMQECFELAKYALGRTSPNPVVGAIVLDSNGVPAGKGYHMQAGMDHAEVIAIKEAGNKAVGGTLVINLEPCCHTGKTLPCTDLIINSKIKEVIFSNYDPNPLVNKKGENILKENKINVITGVLEASGLELNKFFFKWIKTKLPWITLKQAQTLDGKIALKNNQKTWITGELARSEVHKLRNIYDAILVGANTVVNDNPELTVRGIKNGKNPVRVILDTNLDTSCEANVYKKNSKVILVTKEGNKKEKMNNYLKASNLINIIELPQSANGELDLKQLFLELGKREILSVFVEAGPSLASNLILNNLIDEYILFVSPIIFGSVDAIPSLNITTINKLEKSYSFKLFDYKAIGNDFMLSLRPEH